MKKNHKNRWKKSVAFLLAGTLVLLGGCGKAGTASSTDEGNGSGSATGTGAKGRFVESSLNIDGLNRAEGLYQLDDGRYAIFNSEESCLEMSSDKGMTWEAMEQPALKEVLTEDTHLSGLSAYGDGTILALYMDKEDTAVKDENGEIIVENHFIQIAVDGTTKTGDLTCAENVGYMDAPIEVNGRLFTSEGSGAVCEINLEEASLTKVFETGEEGSTALYDCGNVLAAIYNNVPYFYDLTTNQLLDTDMTLADFFRENDAGYEVTMTAGEEAGTIYLACKKGLYRHTIGGSVMEQLVDGALSSLGSPLKSVSGLLQQSDGNFMILFSDGMICHYVYDPDISSVPEKEIKVYSLYDNQMIRTAMASFQREYLDIYINYEVGMTESTSMTETDAIKNLNTDMMAGEGPDILVLDGLPIDAYAEKGMLLDLSDFVTETKQSDTYFTNILSSYQKENKTFALPVRFNIPVLAGKNELTSNVNTMYDLEKALDQTTTDSDTIFELYNAKDILELFYLSASPELQTADSYLDQQKLTEFLTEASKLYEIENRKITDSMRSEYNEVMSQAYNANGGMPESARVSDILKITHQYLQTLAGKQAVMAGYMNGEGYDAGYVSGALQKIGNASIHSLPGLNQTGKVYLPVGVVGISSKSEHVEEAEAFLTALLSDEVQQISNLEGLPVNATSFEKLYDEMENRDFRTAAYFGNGHDAEIYVKGIAKEDRAAIRAIADGLSVPSLTDHTIHDAVIDIGGKALDGEFSIEEGVNQIMKKVGIYAQE